MARHNQRRRIRGHRLSNSARRLRVCPERLGNRTVSCSLAPAELANLGIHLRKERFLRAEIHRHVREISPLSLKIAPDIGYELRHGGRGLCSVCFWLLLLDRRLSRLLRP